MNKKMNCYIIILSIKKEIELAISFALCECADTVQTDRIG